LNLCLPGRPSSGEAASACRAIATAPFGDAIDVHVSQPEIRQKDYPMPVFLLDLIYIAIGVAAFALTALYLGACDNL